MDSGTQQDIHIIDKDESSDQGFHVVGGFVIEDSTTPYAVSHKNSLTTFFFYPPISLHHFLLIPNLSLSLHFRMDGFPLFRKITENLPLQQPHPLQQQPVPQPHPLLTRNKKVLLYYSTMYK